MKLKCVIFDFDGTLFDSMYLWDTVAESYVRSRGKEPKPTVREEVRALSLLQAAEHLKKEYDLAETPEEIMAAVHRAISRRSIPLRRMAIARADICSCATSPRV